MARILIGSSNIRRFYPCDQTKEYPNYKMEAATLQRAFEISMESIPKDGKIIISVLENFIEREINFEGNKTEAMKKTIQSVVAVVVESARSNREARFALAYPILRPKNKWMTDNEDEIRKEFESAINSQCEININRIDAISRGSQAFEEDGVHLTSAAGKMFVGNLIGMAEESFKAEQVDIGQEEDQITKVMKLGKTSATAQIASNLIDLKKSTADLKNWKSHLERNLNSRFRSDNLMFARLRDEMDSETNRKREDRTQVTGLVDPAKVPKTNPERNDYLKNLAKEFCLSIKEDFEGEIMFATTIGNPAKGDLMLEFRVDTVENARDIRKAFATKRSSNSLHESLEKVQVLTVITLATKIRLDIMKAIARRIESDNESAYVPSFLPRPILHIKAKGRGGNGDPRKHLSSLTFADAIKEYGGLIKDSDLTPAYKRAGGNFRGQMRQHFVVLEDQEYQSKFSFPPPGPSEAAAAAGGSKTRGTKRGIDSDGDDNNASGKRNR